LTVAEKLLDFMAVFAALYLSDVLYRALEPGRVGAYPGSRLYLCAASFALLVVFLLERHGGYSPSVSLLGIRETERILRITPQAFLFAVVAAYLCAEPVSRLRISLAAVAVPLFLTLEKWEMHKLLRALRGAGYGARRAVIVGPIAEARRLYSALVRSPKFGIDPVAFVDEDPQAGMTEIFDLSYRGKHCAKVVPGPVSLQLLQELNAGVLVVAGPVTDRPALLSLIPHLAEAGISTYFEAAEVLEPGYWVDFAELDGAMLAHVSGGTSRVLYEAGKRLLDLLGAMVLLTLLAILSPAVAALIKLTSPGPVLFRQERVGKAGCRFTIYKFRTMYIDAPCYAVSPGSGDDPRLTAVGRFLRRTSLDELPQALNVVLGQMSLVGPRPEMPFLVAQHSALKGPRLSVPPGITGLWQISPARAYPIYENLEYDNYYVRYRSLFLDVAILLHSFPFAARGV
jgi:exopolysaccharide biosynthesis polyprenyl glycosylphosphotransferase